jgi:hypothetical protein
MVSSWMLSSVNNNYHGQISSSNSVAHHHEKVDKAPSKYAVMAETVFLASDTWGYLLFHDDTTSDVQVTGLRNTNRKDHILNTCNHVPFGLPVYICDLDTI